MHALRTTEEVWRLHLWLSSRYLFPIHSEWRIVERVMSIQTLAELVDRLRRVESFAAVTNAMRAGQSGTIDGAWGSSCALATAAVVKAAPGQVLIVLPRISDVDDFAADLLPFLDPPPVVFPAWESLMQGRAPSFDNDRYACY